jgi:RNA polymerase-associated protein CTR9
LDPNGKPDIRIGVGLCFAQLDLLEQAKYAIERALERVRHH